MPHQRFADSALALVISLVLVLVGVTFVIGYQDWRRESASPVANPSVAVRVVPFASAEDFSSYLTAAPTSDLGYGTAPVFMESATAALGAEGAGALKDSAASGPARVSETNVQVRGIDEPDVVKTDGTNLYYSETAQYKMMSADANVRFDTATAPMLDESIGPPSEPTQRTRLIKAWPASALAQTGTIAAAGDLLLDGSTLVVLEYNRLVAYTTANPAAPTELWRLNLTDQFVSARLADHTIYLLTSQSVDRNQPCPLTPMMRDSVSITVPCTSIFHPTAPAAADTTYSVFAITTADGNVARSVSFVAPAAASVMYMSPTALYAALGYSADMTQVYVDAVRSAADLFSAAVRAKMDRLMTYELSAAARWTELQSIIQTSLDAMPAEQRTSTETKFTNALDGYLADHQREIFRTSLVKVPLATLTVAATGNIPGNVLNQFSFDEYQDHLRIATTTNSRWFLGGGAESVNDVYVLDSELNQTGQLLDLGLGETIQSARFVGDRGYLVTFKQTDPFFVLDLANPKQPRLAGELKLPGFSSYLDPLTDTLVLGVGQENGNVKFTLFNVSNADAPVELATYKLDEYWSEAQNNHHAFLHDAAHRVVFIPASKGGYILSYANNTLALAATITDTAMKRAIYINDLLYAISANKITVLDENTWQPVASYDLPNPLTY